MSNPWLKKNPFMSMWLSSVNRAAAPIRAQAASHAKRQVNAGPNAAVAAGMEFWSDVLAPSSGVKKGTRKRR